LSRDALHEIGLLLERSLPLLLSGPLVSRPRLTEACVHSRLGVCLDFLEVSLGLPCEFLILLLLEGSFVLPQHHFLEDVINELNLLPLSFW